MSSNLPFEIVQEIFCQLHGLNVSLVPWSRVCKTFGSIAQQTIFKQMTIGKSKTSIDTLHQILSTSRRILANVEVVSIVYPCRDISRGNVLVSPYPNIQQIVDLLYQHGTKLKGLFIAGYRPFPFDNPIRPYRWSHFGKETQLALLRLMAAPSIQSINIDGLLFFSADEDLNLPRLRSLTLHNLYFDDNIPQRTVSYRNSGDSNIGVLQISGGDAIGSLRWLKNCIPLPSHLERMSFVPADSMSKSEWSPADTDFIQRILDSSSATLTCLDISIGGSALHLYHPHGPYC